MDGLSPPRRPTFGPEPMEPGLEAGFGLITVTTPTRRGGDDWWPGSGCHDFSAVDQLQEALDRHLRMIPLRMVGLFLLGRQGTSGTVRIPEAATVVEPQSMRISLPTPSAP